jgi:hypothetical protein
MFDSSNFKSQLSFNWHLGLINVCTTQSWGLADNALCSDFSEKGETTQDQIMEILLWS